MLRLLSLLGWTTVRCLSASRITLTTKESVSVEALGAVGTLLTALKNEDLRKERLKQINGR
jgi:hypothetical protein